MRDYMSGSTLAGQDDTKMTPLSQVTMSGSYRPEDMQVKMTP